MDSPKWDYRVTVKLGSTTRTDLISGGMPTVDAAVSRLKTAVLAARYGKNPRVRTTRKTSRRKQVTGLPDHRYKGYGVASLENGGRLVYMVQPYTTWGAFKNAMSFTAQNTATYAAEKSGRKCAVVPLSQNRDAEVARALQGK